MVFHGTNGDFVGMKMIATYTLDLFALEVNYQGIVIPHGE
jgi:hypothetical protein